MCAMRSLPLAPKPLATMHCFNSSYVVPVNLDAPLWGAGWGRGQLASEMMALCLQLDATILTSCETDHAHQEERERKVQFQHRLPVRVAAVLEQMSELLTTAGLLDTDVETYLRESGLAFIFPRAELCLQEPEQDLAHVDTSIMDSYLLRLTQLHNVATLAQQLSSDLHTCSSHKYIAHQTALLYQCVGNSSTFPAVKKEIEQHFSSLKSACSSEPGHIPRLTPELQSWLQGVCHKLQSEAISFSSELLQSLHQVFTVLHNRVLQS